MKSFRGSTRPDWTTLDAASHRLDRTRASQDLAGLDKTGATLDAAMQHYAAQRKEYAMKSSRGMATPRDATLDATSRCFARPRTARQHVAEPRIAPLVAAWRSIATQGITPFKAPAAGRDFASHDGTPSGKAQHHNARNTR